LRPAIHHLRAAAVLFAFVATFVLATPGLDQLNEGTYRTEAARAKVLKEPFGAFTVWAADSNRLVRMPLVRLFEPLQRPLRIAQAWSLYGGGPSKVKRLEIEVDGVLRHRSKDPDHAWLDSTLRFRRIRPIVSAICGDRSRNTDQMLTFVAGRAQRDFPETREVVVRCTSTRWPRPGTSAEPPTVVVHYRMTAPGWEVVE
jgi:hypothetical protein